MNYTILYEIIQFIFNPLACINQDWALLSRSLIFLLSLVGNWHRQVLTSCEKCQQPSRADHLSVGRLKFHSIILGSIILPAFHFIMINFKKSART